MLRALLVIFCGLLGVGSASAALAGDYPPPVQGSATVSASSTSAGGCVTFTATGFAADTPVRITDNGQVVKVVNSNSAGVVTTQICFNTNATPGEHQLCATGLDVNGQLITECASVDVLGEQLTRTPTVSSGGLPFTGGNVLGLIAIGLLLTAVGYLLIVSSRLRRRRWSSAA